MAKRIIAVLVGIILLVFSSGTIAFAGGNTEISLNISNSLSNTLTSFQSASAVKSWNTTQDIIPNRSSLTAGTYYFQTPQISRMSVISLPTKSDNVQVEVASGQAQQRWRLVMGKDGFAKIKNVSTSKVLTVSGSVAVANANIVQASEKLSVNLNAPGSTQATENLDQKWVVEKIGANYRFVSALNSAFVIHMQTNQVNHTLVLQAKSNALCQQFIALDVSKITRTLPSRNAIAKGTYYLQSKALDTCVLIGLGSRVKLAVTKGRKNQKWVMSVGRDGYSKLRNANTKKVVTVKGSTAQQGAKIYLAKEKDESSANAAGSVLQYENLAQKWVVKKYHGKFILLSALNSQYALQLAKKKAKAGTSTILGKRVNNNRQLFSFVMSKVQPVKRGKRTVKNGIYLIASNAKANRVVTIASKSKKEGANAHMSVFAAHTCQAFKFVYDKQGFYTVTNVNSGKKLSPDAACSVSGVNVSQHALTKSTRQKWRVEKYGSGYRLVNKGTGLALAAVGSQQPVSGNIRMAALTKNRNSQRFMLVRPYKKKVASSKVKGCFYIAMKASSKSVVGIQNESRFEGASVRVRAKRNTNLQRFKITSAGKGCYYLRNVSTNRVVSLETKSKAANTNVDMRDSHGKSYQKWKIVYNDDFSYAFVNAYSGMHLHVVGAKTAENTNIKVFSARTSSAAQAFRLIRTSPTVEGVILNVPCYLQNPDLPTGCESVALTNAIRYWGFNIDKTEIARRWMPYGSDGVYNFIGSPWDSSGWIICAPGIANTANAYFKAHGSSVRAHVCKGDSLSSIRANLYRGFPIVVWTTIGMGSPGRVQWWNNGYPMRNNNHAVVLCGYDPHNGKYLVADSLAGTVWRDGGTFEWLFNEMGRQAVVLSR